MEPKIIQEFLTSDECEQFFCVLEIKLQCRAVERQLNKKNEQDAQVNTFKKHMSLLLHSQLCQNNANQKECEIRHCIPLRNVLNHALRCQLNEACSVKYCRTARRLALHYEICNDQNCPICSFACEANNLKSERPRQVFFTQENHRCGLINCGEFQCNPFRMQAPPNKVGQPRKTNQSDRKRPFTNK